MYSLFPLHTIFAEVANDDVLGFVDPEVFLRSLAFRKIGE